MLRHVFAAMGTTVEALLESDDDGAPAALLAVEGEFERLEAALSRFRPDSDLSRLNRDGRAEASPDLARAVELAVAAREATEGRFDPAIHDSLVAAGYDRTFDELPLEAESDRAPAPICPVDGIRVDGDCVEVEEGVRLDLGGIGKGYAADRAIARLAPLGPCLINAGGDIAVAGIPEAGPWAIALGTPAGELTLALASGGLATSGRDRRCWWRGGEERHHLIDAATGRPARSRWLRVTIAASSAVAAEVAAKNVFLGADPGRSDAVLVDLDGVVTRTGALA